MRKTKRGHRSSCRYHRYCSGRARGSKKLSWSRMVFNHPLNFSRNKNELLHSFSRAVSSRYSGRALSCSRSLLCDMFARSMYHSHWRPRRRLRLSEGHLVIHIILPPLTACDGRCPGQCHNVMSSSSCSIVVVVVVYCQQA